MLARIVIAILAFASMSSLAWGRSTGPCSYPTIEYFVADGDLVVRGVVSKGLVALSFPTYSSDDGKPAPMTRYEKLSVAIVETLRRDPAVALKDLTGQTIEFLVEQIDDGTSPSQRWDGREMLLSLRATTRWRPQQEVKVEICPWIIRLDWGSNHDHMRKDFFWWAFDLTSNDLTAYDVSARRVPRAADVLAKAREAAAFPLPPIDEDDLFYWNGGAGRQFVHLQLIDKSDHDLYAPIDARLEAQVRHWLPRMSESEWIEDNVINALQKIRAPNSPETVEMLKRIALTAPPTPLRAMGKRRHAALACQRQDVRTSISGRPTRKGTTTGFTTGPHAGMRSSGMTAMVEAEAVEGAVCSEVAALPYAPAPHIPSPSSRFPGFTSSPSARSGRCRGVWRLCDLNADASRVVAETAITTCMQRQSIDLARNVGRCAAIGLQSLRPIGRCPESLEEAKAP